MCVKEDWTCYSAVLVVLRLRRAAGAILNQRVLPQRDWSPRHSKDWQCKTGKVDDAANPTVLQRSSQKRPCAKEKPA